jgi:hypothetical protein
MADDKQEPDDEFERFEDLTKRLLKISKSDLDKGRHAATELSPKGSGSTAK